MKAASHVRVRGARRATPEFVLQPTGHEVGGVALSVTPRRCGPWWTLLAAYDQVWVGAGPPHKKFRTTFEDLVTLTGGEAADVGA